MNLAFEFLGFVQSNQWMGRISQVSVFMSVRALVDWVQDHGDSFSLGTRGWI